MPSGKGTYGSRRGRPKKKKRGGKKKKGMKHHALDVGEQDVKQQLKKRNIPY